MGLCPAAGVALRDLPVTIIITSMEDSSETIEGQPCIAASLGSVLAVYQMAASTMSMTRLILCGSTWSQAHAADQRLVLQTKSLYTG